MANPYSVLKPVESSMFSRAGYDESTWQLILEFKSTQEIKAYLNVAPEVADEALTAKSLGGWWNQNIRGNPSWECETLGADPNAPPPPVVEKKADKPKDAKKQPAQPEMGITAEDIQTVDPSYKADDWPPLEDGPLAGLDANFPTGRLDHIAPTYGGIDRSQTTIPIPETQPGDAIHWKDQAGNLHTYPEAKGEAFQASEIATIPTAELLGKWTAPESAAEALELLSERESEIEAIIASCKEAGQAALAVTVKDADSRVKAGEVLNELVKKKDTATELLEPFRKCLHEAYQYAQQKGKAAIDPLDAAIKQVKTRCLAWEDEQRRIKADADRKAREEADAKARKQQEEDRQRLVLADVQDALDDGDDQRAETLFSKPIDVPLPYVAPVYTPSAAPIIEGQSTSQKFKVDETSLETPEGYLESVMTLLRAVKDDKVELRMAASYLRWDLVALNKLAGALKTAFHVPGLSAKPVSNMSVRRK